MTVRVVEADETDDVNTGYVNDGVLDVTNGATETIDNKTFGGTITNTGLMQVGPGSSLLLTGYQGVMQGSGTEYSTLINAGALVADGGEITSNSNLDMSAGGSIVVTDGGTFLAKGDLTGGTIQLENSTFVFGQEEMYGPQPHNAMLGSTTITLGGTSDTLGLDDATGILFDQAANALLVYAQRDGSPYQIGDIPLSGTYAAADFSINHGAVVYVNPLSIGIDVYNETLGQTIQALMQTYTGPVSGLDDQYVNLTADNLNITATTPNVFIHTGSGMDGITVTSGNNILDGSDGSDFMIGGSGNDTFYLDDRNAVTPIFSTIVNFHSGDDVTVWGVDSTNFKLIVLDGQGAPGATGVDLIFRNPSNGNNAANDTAYGDASFVLAGYTSADLTNGRLTLSYGHTPDMPGLPGSDYATIHAT